MHIFIGPQECLFVLFSIVPPAFWNMAVHPVVQKKSLSFYLDIVFNMSVKQKYRIKSVKLNSVPSAQRKAVQV